MILIEETDERFYIGKSTLPEAGRGLFAKEKIKKGDYLEIIGVQVKAKGISDDCTKYAQNYKFASRGKKDSDRLVIPMGYGGIVNHANDPKMQNATIESKNHPIRNQSASTLVYTFLRDIEPGEEIFGNYGSEWQGLLNWAIDESAKADSSKDDWETFLSYDLYNLGTLIKKIKG